MNKQNVKNIYNLSNIQEGMLFHSSFDKNQAPYTHQEWYKIEDSIDIEAFKKGWQKVVDRHDALRTIFISENVKEPIAVVLKERSVDFEFLDLSNLSLSEIEKKFDEIILDDRVKGFDFKSSLLRFKLLKANENLYFLLFSFHHIIIDGWCMGIMFDEFLKSYEAKKVQKEPELPTAPQFVEYIRWFKKQDLNSSIEFYKTNLKDIKKRSIIAESKHSFEEKETIFEIDSQTFIKCDEFCKQNSFTKSDFFQAINLLALANLYNNLDVSFGLVVSGRPAEIKNVDKIVGIFIQMIPFRLNLNINSQFIELIKSVNLFNIESKPHHHISFSDVKSSLGVDGELFDSIFVYENFPTVEDSSFNIKRVGAWEFNNYNLTTQISEHDEKIFIRAIYNSLNIQNYKIENYKKDFINFTNLVLNSPEISINELVKYKKVDNYITSTFTTNPLEDILNFSLSEFKIISNTTYGDYNQLLLELNNPQSKLFENRDFNVILFRFVDLIRGFAGEKEEFLNEQFEILISKLPNIKSKTIFVLAPYLVDESLKNLTKELNEKLIKFLETLPNFIILNTIEHFKLYSLGDIFDYELDFKAHIPYIEEFYSYLALQITRKISNVMFEPYKVISVDCDNTLWEGVVGEDGVNGVKLKPKHIALQNFLIGKQQEGFLITLVSKNNLNDVLEVFNSRSDMVLKLEHIVEFKINWQSKSQNLIELAKSLNLGLNSFIFIDDNETEILEVMQNATEVFALHLSKELENIDLFLDSLWILDKLKVTKEDLERTKMYVAEKSRSEVQKSSKTLFEFLETLNLELYFYKPTISDIPRISQLTFRTNQFNSTTIRRDEEECKRLLLSEDYDIYCVSLADKYGDYGLSGVLFVKKDEKTVIIDNYILSCRILGKGVEKSILATLSELYNSKTIKMPFIKSAKNAPFFEFAKGLNLSETIEDEKIIFEIDKNLTIDNYIKIFNYPKPTINMEFKRVEKAQTIISNSTIFEYQNRLIGSNLNYKTLIFSNILNLIEKFKELEIKISNSPKDATKPTNEIELKISKIFEMVLNLQNIGIFANFFELGGHSLKALRLISLINKEFNSNLSIKDIFVQKNIHNLSKLVTLNNQFIPIIKSPKSDKYIASNVQTRLFTIWNLNKNSTAYNMPMAFEITGLFNIEKFKSAILKVVNQNEILRTNFIIENGVVYQIIRDELRDFFEILEFNSLNELHENLEIVAKTIFDLENSPLFRVYIYKFEDKKVLLFNFHHIIFDGISISNFAKKLKDAYLDKDTKDEFEYKDFSLWQHSIFASEKFKEAENYWIEKLKNLNTQIELPTDKQRGEVFDFVGKRVNFELKNHSKMVELISSNFEISKFALLVAIIKVLIFKLSEQKDIVVATASSGRVIEELNSQIGCFVNTILLRDIIKEEKSFLEFAKSCSETIYEALQNEIYPFEKVVAMDSKKSPSRNGGYDVSISYLKHSNKDEDFGDFSLSSIDMQENIAQCDLAFEFFEDDEGVNYNIRYASSLFEESKILAFHDMFIKILQTINSHKNIKIEDIKLVETKEKSFNFDIKNCLNNLNSDFKLFNYAKNEEFNISSLAKKAHGVIKNLDKEAIVALFFDRDEYMVASLFATISNSLCYLPIESQTPIERVKYILDSANPKIVLSNSKNSETLKALNVEFINLDEVLEIEIRQKEIDFNSLAYLIFTSGTTGNPKGVEIEYKSLINLLNWYIDEYKITKNDVILLMIPTMFDASIKNIISSFLTGAKLVIYNKPFNPIELAELIESQKVTIINCVPSAFKMVLDVTKSDNYKKLQSIRELSLGGEILEVDYFREFINCSNVRLTNIYGPTECSDISTIFEVDLNQDYKVLPIGKSIPNTAIHIVNSKLEELPNGFIGEILISGVGVGRGYINFDSGSFINHSTFGRCYKSGDFGKVAIDENIICYGRRDNQIKIQGNRVELDEIKKSLPKEFIKDSAITFKDGSIYLFFVSNQNISIEFLKSYLSLKLPNYMTPSNIIQVEHILIDNNGKIDFKNMIKDVLVDTKVKEFENQDLLNIFKSVLEVDNLNIYDNFFEFGGNSIKAIALINRLKNELNININGSDIFLYPTVETLSKSILDIENLIYKKIDNKSKKLTIFFPSLLGMFSWDSEYLELCNKLGDVSDYLFFRYLSDFNQYKIVIDELKNRYDEIYLCGFSSGGLIAFDVAKMASLKQLILIDTIYKNENISEHEKLEFYDYLKELNVEFSKDNLLLIDSYINFINLFKENISKLDLNIKYISSNQNIYNNLFEKYSNLMELRYGSGEHFDMLKSENLDLNVIILKSYLS